MEYRMEARSIVIKAQILDRNNQWALQIMKLYKQNMDRIEGIVLCNLIWMSLR